jgi:hypothetical protein
MSFIAAFFAINIEEFPRSSSTSSAMPLRYVAKYMFGIGLGISVPLIVIALTVDDVGYWSRKAKAAFRRLLVHNQDEEDAERAKLEEKVKIMLDAPRVSNIERRRRDSINGGRLSAGVPDWKPPSRKSGAFERDDGRDELSPPRRVNSRTTQISWARASYDRVRGRHSDDIERGRALN